MLSRIGRLALGGGVSPSHASTDGLPNIPMQGLGDVGFAFVAEPLDGLEAQRNRDDKPRVRPVAKTSRTCDRSKVPRGWLEYAVWSAGA